MPDVISQLNATIPTRLHLHAARDTTVRWAGEPGTYWQQLQRLTSLSNLDLATDGMLLHPTNSTGASGAATPNQTSIFHLRVARPSAATIAPVPVLTAPTSPTQQLHAWTEAGPFALHALINRYVKAAGAGADGVLDVSFVARHQPPAPTASDPLPALQSLNCLVHDIETVGARRDTALSHAALRHHLALIERQAGGHVPGAMSDMGFDATVPGRQRDRAHPHIAIEGIAQAATAVMVRGEIQAVFRHTHVEHSVLATASSTPWHLPNGETWLVERQTPPPGQWRPLVIITAPEHSSWLLDPDTDCELSVASWTTCVVPLAGH